MKRILCTLLAATLLLSGVSFAALADVPEREKAQVLRELEIMQGNEHGDLELERVVTRAEFTKLLIAASSHKSAVGTSVLTDPYPDVPRSHWAATWVQMARDTGLVRGDLQGYFHPASDITLAEGVTMLLRLLGYDDNANWPVAQLARYDSLGMDEGVAAKTRDDKLTRSDALHLFYNLLTIKGQSGQPYITTFGHSLNAYGEVDLDAILAENREGPMIAAGDWQARIPFPLSEAALTRNGRVVDPAAIAAYDVIYYIENSRTVEVWSDRVTGTITAILPNTISPSSVMVGGQTYQLETREMIAAFTNPGSWHKGDVVTLLLGRTGGVAGVLAAHEAGAVTVGIVTSIAQAGALDDKGNSFTADTVTIVGTDGKAYPFVWSDDNVEVGDLASGRFTTNGAVVEKLEARRLTTAYTLADDARILDTYGDTQCAVVYPARMDGVRLTGNMVRWYAQNAAGEVTDLILDDVTGDLHQYGILTKRDKFGSGVNTSATYTYDLGGTPGMYNTSKVYGFTGGPIQVRSDDLAALKSVALTTPEGRRGYRTAERVLYYEKDADGNYTLSSLARLSDGRFTYTGWYDKPENEGGRIRVIVGEAK